MTTHRTTAHLSLVAVTLAVATFVTGCGKPVRRKDAAPTQSSAEEAKKLQLIAKVEELPAPTMSPRELRVALWDIAARVRKGETSKVLNDYADRADAARTLEARFLAGAAIPDDDAAWNAYHAIAHKQPKFYWAHAGMAAVYARWKVRDQAEKEIGLCFELGPEITYTYTLRGNLYRAVGEWNLAVRDYATALRGDPLDADARVGLALARKRLNNVQNLRQELEKTLVDLPTQYEAAEALALLLDEEGKLAPARSAWERVETLAPKNRAAKLALARLRGDEDIDGAIVAYEQAGKLQALSKIEQESMGRMYRKVGRSDDEVKSLLLLTKLDAKDLAPWRRLAEIYEVKADQPALEGAYKSILALEPKNALALAGLARLAEKRVQLRQAIEYFREALAAGDAASEAEIQRLTELCQIPVKPLAGTNLTSFYRAVSDSLDKLYVKRLVEVPRLKGYLKVGIQTDGLGKALAIDVKENTLNDPWLEAHLYYALLEAAWPKLKATEPRKFNLTFDLPPIKE